MRKLRLIRDNTHIPFMWMRNINFTISVVLSILSVVAFVMIGPPYGIDFRGGTLIEMKPVQASVDVASVRATLGELNLGDVQVQEVSDLTSGTNILVRIQQQEGGEEAQQEAIARVRAALGDEVEFRRVEIVGPRVSGELARDGAIAMAVAMLLITIYVWFRFEWQFGIGAIACLVHDALLTLGFFTLFQVEFNLSSIAALLTIVGYSVNDTVVIYDRVRENLRKFKKMPLADLIDRSINETLTRTVTTSVTTLIALLALYFFGGAVIRSFVAAMIFGVLVGSYSTIFVGGPMLIFFKLRGDRPSAEDAGTAERAGA